jgi:hypothetical protein
MIASSDITCKLSFKKISHLAEKFEVESVILLSPLFAIFREDVLSKIPAIHLGRHVAHVGGEESCTPSFSGEICGEKTTWKIYA